MQHVMNFLPIFIVVAFPMLYYGGQSSDSLSSTVGIVVLFLGMSGPLIKRVLKLLQDKSH